MSRYIPAVAIGLHPLASVAKRQFFSLPAAQMPDFSCMSLELPDAMIAMRLLDYHSSCH